MLGIIPPWLNVSPELFQNAMSTGARLGLERAGMETGAQDAAQKLQLGYANLAGENARNAATIAGENSRNATNAGIANAAHALEQAKLNFAIDQAGALNNYRTGTLAQRGSAIDALNNYRAGVLDVKNRHEDNTETGNSIRSIFHVGNSLIKRNPDGTVTPIYSGPAAIDPYDRMKYQAAIRRLQNAQILLNKYGPGEPERVGAQKEFDDAKAQVDALDSKRSKVSAASALDANDFNQIPSEWDTQFSNGGDMQDENDPLGILGSGDDEEE